MSTIKYAPKLPLELDSDNNFIKIDDILQNVRQKLKMLVLTNPGEKLMDPEFGVGIRKYLFESETGLINYTYFNGTLTSIQVQDFEATIKQSIVAQTAKYADDITILDVKASLEEQTLYLEINYNYKGFLQDTLELNITV